MRGEGSARAAVHRSRQAVQTRADLTRKRILAAATAEFGRKGLGGARVDEIARRSKSNQRMIYHYFGSKELLFTAVLEAAYSDIRAAEQKLNLDLEGIEVIGWHQMVLASDGSGLRPVPARDVGNEVDRLPLLFGDVAAGEKHLAENHVAQVFDDG